MLVIGKPLIVFSRGRIDAFLVNKNLTRSLATNAEIALDGWNGHSGSLKVIRYTNRCGVYDLLL